MEVASPVQKKAAVTKVPQVAKANPPKKIEESKTKNVPAAPKATVKTEEKKTESSEKLSKNQKKKLHKQNKAKAAATESTVEQPESKTTTKKDTTPKVPVEKCNLTSEKKSEIIAKHNARQIDLNSKTIFIRPIPAKSTPESIRELVPDMVTCRIPLRKVNQAKGFAFIQLNDANQANSYVTKLNGKKFNEKVLIAKLATNREVKNEDEVKFHRLFVNCLAVDVKSNDLKLLFPSAKTIFVHDKANCLGSADVTFKNSEDAVRAFELQHDKIIKNHPIHITFFVKPAASNKNKIVKVNATTKAPAAVNNKKRKHNDDDEDEEETSVVKAKEQAKPGKKIKVDNDLQKILSQIKKATKEESDEESDDDDDSEEAYEINDSEEDDSEVDDDDE
jgi:RNA recognition motif-containing protein